jgi:uncharacterized protein GlcG (DUF336 family)
VATGSVPIYKNGAAVGGVGIEGDGIYTVDRIHPISINRLK